MIHNTCIYGTVKDTDDNLITDTTVKMKYISYNFENIIEKEYENKIGTYQFNLGDSDVLTFAEDHHIGDVVIITNETNGTITYSNKVILKREYFIEHNIVDEGSVTVIDDEANNEDNSKTTVVKAIILEELSDVLYSYYSVKIDDELVYECNGPKLIYKPTQDGEHKVTQYAVNKTTGDITSKELTIDVLQTEWITKSLDYIFYTKRKKILRCELPKFVTDTLILADGWYYENGKLMGKHDKLGQLEMEYYNGKVIVKTYIGDIIDY